MTRKKIWNEDLILEEIKTVMEELEIEYMPSFNEIKSTGREGLANQIKSCKKRALQLGIYTKQQYNRALKEDRPTKPNRKPIRKADLTIYKDEARQRYDKERDELYVAQCMASEVKSYTLSADELAKYQKLPEPEKGNTSVKMINALASAWGKNKARSMEKLEL